MIRLGIKKDIESINILRKQVNDLHVKCEPNIFKGFTNELKEYVNNFIQDENKILLVYEEDNKIVSYAMLEILEKAETSYRFGMKFLEIHEIGVDINCRSKGIGQQMMGRIKQIAKENNLNQIQLNCWSFNEKALKFYEKQGFKRYKEYFRFFVWNWIL